MHETRRRILELLRVRGGQTVRDLGAALGLTRTAVMSHLAALQAEGAVVRGSLRRGARRPSVVYQATRRTGGVFPEGYEEFSLALLGALKRGSRGTLATALTRVGEQWLERDRPRVEGLWGSARAEAVRQILEERGFLPTLETRGDTRVLREHNCPLMRVTAEHPEICEMVHRWLQSLVGTPVTRTQCLRQDHAHSEYHFPAS